MQGRANSYTKKLFNISNLSQAIEFDELSFKLLKVFLVVRMVEDDNVVHVEEEDDPTVHPKAWKALDRL